MNEYYNNKNNIKQHQLRLVLFDGNNLLYKSFYCSKSRSVQEVRKIFLMNFFNVKNKLNGNVKIVWDSDRRATWRRKLYPKYKIQRKIDDDDHKILIEAKWAIKELLHDKRFNQYELETKEADDIVAHFVTKRIGFDHKIYIVSADKDFYQLLNKKNPQVVLYRIGNKKTFFTYKDFVEKYDIHPRKWIDVRALSGDPSDNIIGIDGVGIKRAIDIVNEYGRINRKNIKQLRKSKYLNDASFDDFKRLIMNKKLISLVKDYSGQKIDMNKNRWDF